MTAGSAQQHECVERAVRLVRDALDQPSPWLAAQLAVLPRELKAIPPSVHSEGQLLVLAGVCRFFQKPEQDEAQALPAAQLLEKRAHALGRPHERLSALLVCGQIYADLDNALEAIERFALARLVAQELGLERAEVVTLTMAAQVLRATGVPAAAETVARRALSVCEGVDGLGDVRAACWIAIAQWHLCTEQPEQGLEAVARSRGEIADDAGDLLASADCLEVLFRVRLGQAQRLEGLLDRLKVHARSTGLLGAAIAHSVARGAVDSAQGLREGRMRLTVALEKARRVPRLLPDVLCAAIIAAEAAGDEHLAERHRTELSALFEARRTAAQLQLALVRGPVVGFGAIGRAFDAGAFERRLAATVDRLLRGREADSELAEHVLLPPISEARSA